MNHKIKTALFAFFALSISPVHAEDRICVNGEAMTINNVRFLGHVTNVYKQFGQPVKKTEWFDSASNQNMTTLIYSGISFTTSNTSSGYDRVQRVVITKPGIVLPKRVQVGMPESLLHTILGYQSNSSRPLSDTVWRNCNCYCDTTAYFTMDGSRRVSQIVIDYSGY